jgi:hypothetical protein
MDNTSNIMDLSANKHIDDNTKNIKKKKKKNKKNRCAFEGCKKKLSIAAVNCKCEKRFCGIHRPQERHQCPVIKTLDKTQIMQKCGLGGGTFCKLEVI